MKNTLVTFNSLCHCNVFIYFLMYYMISIILCMVKKIEMGYMNVGKVATHIIKVRTQ
jgi:hypothetical protein